jgi:hypothetical protein
MIEGLHESLLRLYLSNDAAAYSYGCVATVLWRTIVDVELRSSDRLEEAQGRVGRVACDQEVVAEGLKIAQGPQPAQGVVGK